MGIAKKLALVLAVSGGLFGIGGTASANHTYLDVCAGAVEADGCWYCSRDGGLFGESHSYCHYGYAGYNWERCSLWVTDVCVIGTVG